MSTLNWETLTRERDEWVARNFPPYTGEIPGNDSIIGCIEELGELAHAHLKKKQGIRGTTEQHDEAAQDAIGDIVVYLLGVMSAQMDVKQVGLIRTGKIPNDQDETIFLLAYEIGMMSGTTVGSMDGSWSLGINNILKYCELYCDYEGWNFDVIVKYTWDHVKRRDWNTHRAEGAVKDDPAMKDPNERP